MNGFRIGDCGMRIGARRKVIRNPQSAIANPQLLGFVSCVLVDSVLGRKQSTKMHKPKTH